MYMDSQWLNFVLFLHDCISFSVSFAVPYSCLLFRMCVAYAEAGLLVLMQRICSLCLIVIGLHDSPTYALLHVLHFISYTPLGFVVSDFRTSCWHMVLLALKATLMLVFFNKLVTFLEFSNRLPTQTTMFEGGGNTTSD
jgi:hypothetical protein